MQKQVKLLVGTWCILIAGALVAVDRINKAEAEIAKIENIVEKYGKVVEKYRKVEAWIALNREGIIQRLASTLEKIEKIFPGRK